MKELNKANGLVMLEIKSTCRNTESIDNLAEINNYIKQDSFVVAYLDDKVLAGKYKNQQFFFFNNEQINKDSIQRIRIFNRNEELMLWRSRGILKGRYRKDEEGEITTVVDNDQVLFGTTGKDLNGYTKLTEKRGTELTLPFSGLNNINEEKNRIKIRTRNYVTINEIHQASYCDNRFVEFVYGINNESLEV